MPQFIIDVLNLNFKKFYTPSETVFIDETLILFKGKCSHKQHIKNKPKNTGLKFYSICDSSHYLYDFWLYIGKKQIDKRSNKPIEIIKKFVSVLPHKETIIVCDNYYGSLELGDELHKMNKKFYFHCSNQ